MTNKSISRYLNLRGPAITAVLAAICLTCSRHERNNPFDASGKDWNPPVVTAMRDTTWYIRDTLTVTASGYDVNGSVAKYVWARNGTAFTDTTIAGALPVTWPDSGRKVVRVKAIDDDAVVSAVDSCVVTVTLGEPVVAAIRDTVVSATGTASVTITVHAVAVKGTIDAWYWDTGAVGWDDSLTGATKTFTNSSGGPMRVIWAVRNNEGFFSVFDTFVITFNRPPVNPVVSAPSTSAGWLSFNPSTGKGTLSLALSASDPDLPLDTLTYTLFTGDSPGSLTQVYLGKAAQYNAANIDSGTTVYWRLKVRDLFGDTAVASGSFVAPPSLPSDIDGNVYHTVVIGSQEWMVENLKTTKYNDGTAIPLVTDGTEWNNLTTPGYCWYNNDAATYKNTYGALYNWYSVNMGKLAPTGWHVPTDSDWSTLGTYLGGDAVAGGKLKEVGTTHWNSPNTGATNETGFSALPGGSCGGGNFVNVGIFGNWWSATENGASIAYSRSLSCSSFTLGYWWNYNKNCGFSVRCVRDP
jgi:uncharacterized protein (TIGR02145 family)